MPFVLTLVGHGCPPQAVVAACGLAERTLAAFLTARDEAAAGNYAAQADHARARFRGWKHGSGD